MSISYEGGHLNKIKCIKCGKEVKGRYSEHKCKEQVFEIVRKDGIIIGKIMRVKK